MNGKPLVYLLDDDQTTNTVMVRRFEKLGCEAESFTRPEDFFKALEKRKPRLFVIDIDLQHELTGFDVIRELKENRRFETPILVMSGSQGIDTVAQALEIGADDYIVKPPLRLIFKETVMKYLDRGSAEKFSDKKFRFIGPEKSELKISFPVEILEIRPFGITILSDHLIKKGTLVHFSGKQIKAFALNCEKFSATVILANMQVQSDRKVYEIEMEIEPSQETALADIQNFLSIKGAEESEEANS